MGGNGPAELGLQRSEDLFYTIWEILDVLDLPEEFRNPLLLIEEKVVPNLKFGWAQARDPRERAESTIFSIIGSVRLSTLE